LIVEDENTAIDFMDIYIKDLADSVRFTCPFADYKVEYKEASGRYNPSFSLRSYSNQEVTAVFAPDAVSPIIELINSAKKSIYVEQFYIYTYWGEKESPFLEALIDRAREGIDVKVLLDSYQYNIEENDPKSNLHTFEYINEIAKKENLSMEARLIDLDKLGLEILHAKGMIIDNDKVLVSTINWNENSPRHNREVGIVVSGNAANYFTEAFMYDWEGGKTGSINTSVVILLAIALALVIIIWRRRKWCKNKLYTPEAYLYK
jgi:phosphatidylserine/phosphatidylglycerophosphate/cardiolipin synthase-like enzyme